MTPIHAGDGREVRGTTSCSGTRDINLPTVVEDDTNTRLVAVTRGTNKLH